MVQFCVSGGVAAVTVLCWCDQGSKASGSTSPLSVRKSGS